jgi:hypothetical protein
LDVLNGGEKRARLTMLLSLLALQLLTFNTFLRVVTTGVEDPPSRTRTFTLPSVEETIDAHFGDVIALRGYEVEGQPAYAGDTVTLTLYWQALAPMTEPYTVFTHLHNGEGTLIAQQDNMPLAGAAPTTCWVPGEVLTDRYELPIDPQTPTGTYTLSAGLYAWPSGERLPARGPASEADQSVTVTQVTIQER